MVEQVLMRELDVRREQLTHDARLVEDLGADSLSLVEIAMAIEDRLDLSLPEDRWERVKTVGEVFEALAEGQQPQHPRTST